MGLSASPAAGARPCGALQVRGESYDATIQSGHVSCREAYSTLKAFLSGQGTEHGGREAPSYEKTWTLHGGWRCRFDAAGAGCTRRHPAASILALLP
jgi:hypothetical protein